MADRYIPEHRRTQFKAKNQFKPDELRRRREEQQVEIRKQKREENLAKRRGIQTSDGGIIGGQVGVDSDEEEGGAIEGEVSCISFFIPSAIKLQTAARDEIFSFRRSLFVWLFFAMDIIRRLRANGR
jgi:hypothetical protein